MSPLRSSARWIAVFVLAALYFGAGKLGLALAFVHPNASAVWPATGIAIAAILLLGREVWPGVLLGAFAVNATTASTPLLAAALISAGNTLEALTGAWLVQRYAGGVRAFDRAENVFRYAALAGVASSVVAATIGAASLVLWKVAPPERLGSIWLTWCLGDMGGSLLVGPLLILWVRDPGIRWTREQTLEIALLATLALVLAQAVFGGWLKHPALYAPLAFCALPLLAWVGFRFGVRECATAMLILSSAAIVGTLRNRGPFALAEPNASMLLLQEFLCVISVTGLAIAASVAQHRSTDIELLNTERRLAALFHQVTVGVAQTDLAGRFVHVNKRYCEIVGRTPKELLALRMQDVTHPDDLPDNIPQFQRLIAGGPDFVIEKRYLRPDGSAVWVNNSVSAVDDEQGRPRWTVALVQDITPRKLAEQELRQRTEQLARSNSELERFAYVASHDLQEPLRMVTSYTQLLRSHLEERLDPESSRFMGFVIDGAARMQKLVADLLLYSRVGFTQERAATALESVFTEALGNLQGALEESGAIVTHDPLPVVGAHPGDLLHLLQNLIGNAIKFRGEEPPRIHVSARAGDGSWTLSVRDNGIGIEPEYHEKIFGIFQRLHRRAEFPGTGVGLAICKKIVEQLGGKIWVESRLGDGSTFSFTLPGAAAETAQAPAKAS